MSEKNEQVVASAETAAVGEQGLELGLQELEALEAPGFWTGFSAGTAVVSVAVGSAALIT
ncbi:daptide-type RiPP [Streptomyces sp. NPDC060194]|uniref:daptide-type RiPP n=1 Tax=Streptomyces sp. NPDC060194 TaxID=3347069 RepID=UPI003647C17D